MGGGRKRRRRRERENTVDVHLSCIIAANASAAILALETMWGGAWWVLLKSQSDSSSSSSSSSSLLPLLFSDYINTHTHTHTHTHKTLSLSLTSSSSHTHTLTHTLLHYPPMNSSGRSQPSSFLWTQLFLNKVLMVLTSSSNKPLPSNQGGLWSPGSAEACGYYRGNVLILLDYSLSPSLSLSLSPSVCLCSPSFCPRSLSKYLCLSGFWLSCCL